MGRDKKEVKRGEVSARTQHDVTCCRHPPSLWLSRTLSRGQASVQGWKTSQQRGSGGDSTNPAGATEMLWAMSQTQQQILP